MRVLFFINTPSQAYTWKNLIKYLLTNGHQVGIIARDEGATLKILESAGFQYQSFKTTKSRSSRLLKIADHLHKTYQLSRNFHPSIVFGFGVDAALCATLYGASCIAFIDDEPTFFQNYIVELLSRMIITPACFKRSLGKKQVRINGYKELAYLHPNYFQPDRSIYKDLGLNENRKYVILRFNAWNAIHDVGQSGFSLDDKIKLVKELEKSAHVFVSQEGNIPEELKTYQLKIPNDKIHQAIYYADLLVADTGTMVTEAAILGTPAINCCSMAAQFGNFNELEHDYGLLYSFRDPQKAINKAIECIHQPDMKKQWARKRQILLAKKIDVTKFLIDLVETLNKRPEQI